MQCLCDCMDALKDDVSMDEMEKILLVEEED